MARRVFYSFHYARDVGRANVVKNSWVTKKDCEEAGFFDSSAFETAKRTSPDALKRFLNAQLEGSSVTCVLIGNQTAYREWVRYEIIRSFVCGKGLVGVYINAIPNFSRQVDVAGPDPFRFVGFEIHGNLLKFKEWNGSAWQWYSHIPSMPAVDVRYWLMDKTNTTFDQLFRSHDWVGSNGYDNIGPWVEAAASQAKR